MKPTRSEREIIESWEEDSSEILVSICCLTFNHALYIESAIEGFLNQKTNFPIEIIIHDDASNDGTQDLLRRYQKKYSHLIRLVCQSENKYSKGISPFFNYLLPEAKGRYVAICEGDDCWICENKLQKQVDLLLKSQGEGLSFHSAKSVDVRNGHEKIVANHSKNIFKLDEIVAKGASLMPTASIVAERSLLCDMPEFVKTSRVGDYFIQVCCGVNGALYLNECCSVYRMHTESSWTASLHSKVENFVTNTGEMFEYVEQLKEWLIIKGHSVKGIDGMKANLLLQHYYLSIKAKSFYAMRAGLKHASPKIAILTSKLIVSKLIIKSIILLKNIHK